MTDAHFHRNTYDTFLSLEGREVAFFGIHPWQSAECGVSAEEIAVDLRRRIAENPHAGVGEIGLDRLKTKNIPDLQRTIFETQLALAAEFRRPVVLHGAKSSRPVSRLWDASPRFFFMVSRGARASCPRSSPSTGLFPLAPHSSMTTRSTTATW